MKKYIGVFVVISLFLVPLFTGTASADSIHKAAVLCGVGHNTRHEIAVDEANDKLNAKLESFLAGLTSSGLYSNPTVTAPVITASFSGAYYNVVICVTAKGTTE